jgi:hypothetical protein
MQDYNSICISAASNKTLFAHNLKTANSENTKPFMRINWTSFNIKQLDITTLLDTYPNPSFVPFP